MLRSRLLLLPVLLVAACCAPGVAQAAVPPVNTTITSGFPPYADTTPTFGFKADQGSADFVCQMDDGPTSYCAYASNPNEIQEWTSPAVGQGDHTFKVHACYEHHESGEYACDPTPATVSFHTDSIGPDTTFLAGSTPNGARLRDRPVYKLEGADPITGAYRCWLDGVQFTTDCDWDITLSHNVLTEGPHLLEVQAMDPVGNWGPKASRTFTMDYTGPELTFTSPSRTNDATPTISWSPVDDGSGAITTECKLDGVAAPCAGTTFTPAAPLADGGHTVSVRLRDGLGNQADWRHREFQVDTVAPALTGVAFDAAAKRVTFVAEGADSIECRVDAGPFAACTSPYDVSALAGGHTVTIRARDLAGNEATAGKAVELPAARTPITDTRGTQVAPPAPVVQGTAPVTAARASTTAAKKKTTCATSKQKAKAKKKKASKRKARAAACTKKAAKKPKKATRKPKKRR